MSPAPLALMHAPAPLAKHVHENPDTADGRESCTLAPVTLSEPLFDLVWRPGQRVPEKPAPVLKPVAPQGPVRWCRWCGFEGPRAEYEKARECPQCGEPWV